MLINKEHLSLALKKKKSSFLHPPVPALRRNDLRRRRDHPISALRLELPEDDCGGATGYLQGRETMFKLHRHLSSDRAGERYDFRFSNFRAVQVRLPLPCPPPPLL